MGIIGESNARNCSRHPADDPLHNALLAPVPAGDRKRTSRSPSEHEDDIVAVDEKPKVAPDSAEARIKYLEVGVCLV
jgi:hypothetical protein